MTDTNERTSFHNGTKTKSSVKAFTQNTREEVRDLGDVSGCISAESGTHQTTYVCVRK